MFKKKQQPQYSFNSVDDSRVISYDFRLRNDGCNNSSGYFSFRPIDYRLYHKLEEAEMLPIIDEHLEKLFSGSVDEANDDMLVGIIFGAIREAAPDLRHQRLNHRDFLRRLAVRIGADPEDIERIKKDREEELNVLKADYKKICEMLEECKEF